jgi:hypothetical protein
MACAQLRGCACAFVWCVPLGCRFGTPVDARIVERLEFSVSPRHQAAAPVRFEDCASGRHTLSTGMLRPFCCRLALFRPALKAGGPLSCRAQGTQPIPCQEHSRDAQGNYRISPSFKPRSGTQPSAHRMLNMPPSPIPSNVRPRDAGKYLNLAIHSQIMTQSDFKRCTVPEALQQLLPEVCVSATAAKKCCR